LFDKDLNSDPYSLSFWIKGRVGQSGNDRMALFGDQYATGLLGSGMFINLINSTAQDGGISHIRSIAGSTVLNFQYWQGGYAQDKYMHIVVTSDGSNTSPQSGMTFYINGRKNRADQTSAPAGVLPVGGMRPTDSMYYHGFWNSATGDTNKQPAKTERIQVFNKELTPEEVLDLYHNIDAARGGSPTVSNLFRDWDFSAHAAGVVPELTGSGFDMTIVTGGAQPGNPDFY
jgi:hypothetical protein